jgi:hypothetical protein
MILFIGAICLFFAIAAMFICQAIGFVVKGWVDGVFREKD